MADSAVVCRLVAAVVVMGRRLRGRLTTVVHAQGRSLLFVVRLTVLVAVSAD